MDKLIKLLKKYSAMLRARQSTLTLEEKIILARTFAAAAGAIELLQKQLDTEITTKTELISQIKMLEAKKVTKPKPKSKKKTSTKKK